MKLEKNEWIALDKNVIETAQRTIREAQEKDLKKLEEKMMNVDDIQVGGDHYKSKDGEQHWNRIIRLFGWYRAKAYFVAAITKYVERHEKKNGLEDLKKAAHYLQKMIEEEEKYQKELNEKA